MLHARTAKLLSSAGMALAVPVWLPGAAQAQSASAPAPRSYRVTLPMLFDGVYQGDIAATVSGQGQVSVDGERLILLLGARLSAGSAEKIRSAIGPGGEIPIEALAPLGVNGIYDSATLQLKFSIPVGLQDTQRISTGAVSRGAVEGPVVAPAGFSASTTFTVHQNYRWSGSAGTRGFAPVSVAADIAVNAGGSGGVSVFGQLEYDGSRTRRFNRGNFQVIHDDEGEAIRYTVGDVAPSTTGFQTAPLMGGISIDRQYGAIQPLRSIRPSGRLNFVLDRPATVEVVVNGATIRTLSLAAGQYDLRDFPFFNGVNEVELYVVDEVGRRLLTRLSQYYSPQLLDRGIFEFGVTGGLLQNRSGTGPRYDRRAPAISGFARYGLTGGVTLGVNGQATRNQWNAGFETALTTPIGTFGVAGSLSHYNGAGSGSAGLASYEAAFQGGGAIRNIRINLEAQGTSRHFTPLITSVPLNRTRFSLTGRASAIIPGNFGLGVGVSRYLGRDGEPDQSRYSFNLSRSIGPLNASVSFERVERDGSPADNRGLLSLSLPLGNRRTIRSSFDSRGNAATLELSQYPRDEVGSLGVRAAVTRSDSGVSGTGELVYAHNRFGLRIDHDLIMAQSGAVTSLQSGYTFSTELAFADGKFAIGRPVGPRFAIVDRHPTLEGAQVDVWQGAVRDRPQSRAAALGPALVAAGSPYLPTQLRVDVRNLPAGYDIGPGQYAVRPGAAGGYGITIGSDASRIVIGVARNSAGDPIALQGGTLVRAGEPGAAPILVFTNRNGRFVATGIAPGTYILTLGEKRDLHATITVSKDVRGTVMIGDIVLGQPDARPSPPPAPSAVISAQPAPRRIATPKPPRDTRFTQVEAEQARVLAEEWRRIGHARLQDMLAEQGLTIDPRQLRRLYAGVCRAARQQRPWLFQSMIRCVTRLDRQVAAQYRMDVA